MKDSAIQDLLITASKHFGLDIYSNSRLLRHIQARAVVYSIIRESLFMTFMNIAKVFSKNHATIMHAINELPYMIKQDPSLEYKKLELIDKWGVEFTKCNLESRSKKIKNLHERIFLCNLEMQLLSKQLKFYKMSDIDCKYAVKDIDKILNYKSWSDKKKIDTLFHIDCTMYANLGTDSTIGEKNNVRTQSRIIYRAIKTKNSALGKLLLDSMDK